MPDPKDAPQNTDKSTGKIRDEDRTYDPSTPEANRNIEQGGGVGARDLAAQREPTEQAEHDPFKDNPDIAEAAERSQG